MKVVITGGGGFIGLRLAKALLARGTLVAGDKSGDKQQSIARITLLDTSFAPNLPSDARLEIVQADIADAAVIERVVTPDTASIFHLAAVVSGGAESDFDLGMRVNLDATRLLLERARRAARPARVVFASSVAAFGGDLPAVLDDTITPNPQTSYGMQKVVDEYLLSDYSRKGFMDGRSLRLPTIVVRPGKPNLAASSFASAIFREPLNGVDCDCPVASDTGIWMLSPRRVVEAFIQAHELPAEVWGTRRVVNLPGITVSIKDALEALARVAGPQVARRVAWKPDARIQAIVKTWPVNFNTPRALAMGFKADPDVETIIRDYIADEGIRV
jgi:nucleoside-diphosphate-sugar epimerase